MRKMKVILLFLLSFVFAYASSNNFENIKNLVANIDETTYINETKNSNYILTFKRPNQVKKEIESPELNKGEIYIYDGNKKIVYLPFFDQVTEEEINSDENEIIDAINYILNLEKENKQLAKEYKAKKLKDIILKNGTKIGIDNLKEVDGYLMPFKFIIYDNDTKIATLLVKKYSINVSLSDEEFKLK